MAYRGAAIMKEEGKAVIVSARSDFRERSIAAGGAEVASEIADAGRYKRRVKSLRIVARLRK